MARSRRERLEFRFYEIPQGESVLALLGESWVRTYGWDVQYLHFHNLYEVGYCHYGTGVLSLQEEQLPFSDDMISLIPAKYPHNTVSEGKAYWEYLFLDPEQALQDMYPGNPPLRAEKLAVITRAAALYRSEEQPEITRTVHKIFREMQRKGPYYRETVRSLTQVFFWELLRIQEDSGAAEAPAEQDCLGLNRVQPALEFIENNYARQIKITELAECCGLSETHFRRVFHESVQMTPMDYLNLVRVQKACRLLNQKDSPMEIVAMECGFTSISAFTRNFKKYLDITPYKWKRSPENYRGRLLDYNISALKGW